MYNYFIQTKKKIHKLPTPTSWLDYDGFREFLIDVKSKDSSPYIKSWRTKAKKGKKNDTSK